MPRTGAESQRRKALIDAAVHMIGQNGSLDVSVKQIADLAGMSPALAFHYFGDKDAIIIETMRHLLRQFSREATSQLTGVADPIGRVQAIIAASFAPSQFDRRSIAAWLVFYLHAYSSEQAARLLHIYTRRLHSNLLEPLRKLLPENQAADAAVNVAATIDGLYIRHALRTGGPDAAEAVRICNRLFSALIARRADISGEVG
jgi:TetR/AcrR family transcriptional regulator, transcriptional repressor of bet genes